MEEKIKLLRERLIKELSDVEEGIHVELEYDPVILQVLLFEDADTKGLSMKSTSSHGNKFALPRELLTKIDFSNVIFDNFKADYFDFTGLYNVRLDPQILYGKSLVGATLNGVRFVGSFCNTYIRKANFKGSIGARINPSKLERNYSIVGRPSLKHLENCIFEDVTFTDIIDCSYCLIERTNFTGSKNSRIKIDNSNVEGCVFTDAELIGDINSMWNIEGVNFTGAKHMGLINSKIELNPKSKRLSFAKFNGVKFTDSFDYSVIDHTDFTGSKNAVIDLRTINKEKSDIYSCNFTDAIVIDEFGKTVYISADGKITNSVEDELDILLNLKAQSSLIKKEELEFQHKKRVEEARKEINNKINELTVLLKSCEKLGIEPRNLYHSVPMEQELFLVRIDDHYEINRDLVDTDSLRFLNLSMIDFTNVLVKNIDFRNSGARIYPQKVYKKDISGCKFDEDNIKFYDDMTNVNIENTDFGKGFILK